MDICFVSDLHVDHNSEFINWKAYPADVLLVAGDTSNSIGLTAKTLNRLAKIYPKVLTVCGNHENYANVSQNRTVKQSEELLQNLVSENVYVLSDTPVKIGDINFIGSNGWYSFDYQGDVEYNREKYISDDSPMNDNSNIGFSKIAQPKPWELAAAEADRLYKAVSEITMPSFGGGSAKVAIVTHTAPIRETLSTDPKHLPYNPFYCNLAMSRIMDDFSDEIVFWHHGHTHFRQMKYYNGVPVIVNPRGRTSENPRWTPEVLDF